MSVSFEHVFSAAIKSTVWHADRPWVKLRSVGCLPAAIVSEPSSTCGSASRTPAAPQGLRRLIDAPAVSTEVRHDDPASDVNLLWCLERVSSARHVSRFSSREATSRLAKPSSPSTGSRVKVCRTKLVLPSNLCRCAGLSNEWQSFNSSEVVLRGVHTYHCA